MEVDVNGRAAAAEPRLDGRWKIGQRQVAPARVGSRNVDFRPGNPGLDVVGVIRIEVRWIDQVGLGRNMQQHQIGRQRAVGVECRVDRQPGQRAAAVDDEVESFGLAEAKAQPHVVMHA